MSEVLNTIQLLVAPAVMISACGLLCLALYNRLAAIVSRARAFHKEWFDVSTQLKTEAEHEGGANTYLRQRVDALDEQVHQILGRAKLVRNALLLLIFTIIFMLGCSVALGLSIVSPAFAKSALAMFALGIASMVMAMVLAIAELRSALDPVMLEKQTMETMDL